MERTFHLLLYRAFHAQRNFLRPSLGELGLGPGQPKLLNYLMNRGPCRQRELADYFEIDPAAVCRMLDCLQKSGFVTRRADGQSRRRDVVELTEAGRRSPLRFLDGYKPVLHWHGDIFDLPEGAELLASTPMTPHQAFRVGNRVLALQFHPEADADRLESWLVGHACELAHAAVDPRRLRQETKRVGANAREAGQAMLRDWLAQW